MDTSQHEIYEYARQRVSQKKRLFTHFIFLVIGSAFLFAANKWLGAWAEQDWYIWAITAWLFIFILHLVRVLVTDRFMNKNWERRQIDRLMALQEKRIGALQDELQNKKP